ncbi:hypothetical protein M4R23_01200 [Acidovorax sp. GBBC 3332]|nr:MULTISPECIES: hypothetical protein [unclassified Acidovorax]MDA8448337.1 hypothetical protein [Acidovorax sp. GBBC 3297]MDA8457696.1 hypothetical protein [Acidovorax sp. GBBC 3333]MDA8462780.1 hypothetical protein [Acidovorax sp. GBBC 3332]MDA8467766.1 hypothetical protein [Acidovorax sp. GBBC 3299]WCM77787.1 hypothetical protein M5C94_20050 [Acidovorax sp. GBBC 712]
MPTRAWGDGAGSHLQRCSTLAALCLVLVLQGMSAGVAAGAAAGAALVPAAWMVAGWGMTLAMNQWPEHSLRWARRLGAAGLLGCAGGLAVRTIAS